MIAIFNRSMMAASVLLAAVAPGTAFAQSVIYLDFEGIAPYPSTGAVLIGGYYNGGTASNGRSGPNYGVEFTSAAQLLCLNTAAADCSNTSRGGLGSPGSTLGALYFPDANPAMNVAAGFTTGFAGVYSAPFTAGTSVNIYEGLNGTGALLASLVLGTTQQGAVCDQTISRGADYCPFTAFSLSFGGTARSVVFGGTVNSQVFDDFTFGSNVVGGVVPEPATWAMMLVGFAMVGATARYRRRSTTALFV